MIFHLGTRMQAKNSSFTSLGEHFANATVTEILFQHTLVSLLSATEATFPYS